MEKISTKIIKDLNSEFIGKWQELWESSKHAHFFNSPSWFLAYCDSYPETSYCIFVLKIEGKIKAIFPLVKSKKFGVKVFCSPGGIFLAKSTLLLTDSSQYVIRNLLNKIADFGNLYLAEVNEQIAYSIAVGTNSNFLKVPSSVVYYLSLNPDPLRFLSKKQRSKIVNKFKKNSGYLTFKHYRKNLKNSLEKVFKINANSYKKLVKGYHDPFSDISARMFFLNLTKRAPEGVVISILHFLKTPIVYGVGFLCKNIYFASQTAYLPEFRKLIPGKLELYCLLKRLQKDGVEIFDFGRGECILKREFTNLKVNQYDIYFSKKSVVRMWWIMALFVTNTLKKNRVLYKIFNLARKNLFLLKNTAVVIFSAS